MNSLDSLCGLWCRLFVLIEASIVLTVPIPKRSYIPVPVWNVEHDALIIQLKMSVANGVLLLSIGTLLISWLAMG